ncbi:TetR/AcrR family transcriptional regulator [Pseudorhodoplanes sp.]|uniref:TetR/AcrR family transcriptional regulator n=1 Tax=Pseudorhodoplanes sp. TaxID=1934341 RepID=UPI0039198290
MAVRKATQEVAARPGTLDAAAWIAAAFDVAADKGMDAVRVEPLAKALSVTKGSFYWHFADRRALIDAMLRQWADRRIAAIREQAPHDGNPALALRRLAELYGRRSNARGLAVELAIRAFAHGDAKAGSAVQDVDRERLKHVAALFERLGYAPRDANARAVLFYAFLFGQSLLDRRAVAASGTEIAIAALIEPPR